MMDTIDKRRAADGITGGLFLIGLGALALTNWWWPGIMVVLGIATCSGLVFRGQYWQAVITGAVFFGIPLLVETNIRWEIFGPMLLIGVGVISLVRAFFLRDLPRDQ